MSERRRSDDAMQLAIAIEKVAKDGLSIAKRLKREAKNMARWEKDAEELEPLRRRLFKEPRP